MSIESVSGTDSSTLAAWLESLEKAGGTTTVSSSSTTSAESTTETDDSSRISGMSQLFSQLAALAKDDPEQFKAACSEIAAQLTTAAAEASDEEAEALTRMAEQFSAAAESGDASDLQPPKPPEGAAPPSGAYPAEGSDATVEEARKAAGDLLEQICQNVLGGSSSDA